MSEVLTIFDRAAGAYTSTLKSAHAEICKLQGLDPEKYDWPEWSPQANTLRWLPKAREELCAAIASPPQPDALKLAKDALEEIANRHIGDQPAALDITDEQWVRRCYAQLRKTAYEALAAIRAAQHSAAPEEEHAHG